MKNTCFAVLIAIASLWAVSCDEVAYNETKDGYDVYRILKGGNGVQRESHSLDATELRFDIKFDASAMYNGNQGMTVLNKALGFTDCSSDKFIDANSARFAWRWHDGSLELFSLTLVDNVEYTAKLANIAVGQNYRCMIQISDSSYYYSVDGQMLATARRGCGGTDAPRQIMNPYFGNDTITAPHEIIMLIKQY